MATNLLAPNGLSFSKNFLGAAVTFQANPYTIKKGYASNIGMGDLVKTGTGTDQGYIVLAAQGDTADLGVFAGVLPYYDATLQGVGHGLNGSYQSTMNPNADVPCLVADDPFGLFIAQVSGGPWAVSWRGRNINWTAATNGAPNISGRSVLSLDASTIGTDNTLPFRIVDVVGLSGGPNDPANVNPWILVRLNTSEATQQTGI